MKQLSDNHKTAISEAFNALTKEVHNRALDSVLQLIDKRMEQIERLLDNGSAITETVSGDHFIKISNKRHELYMKKWELHEIQRVIYDIYIL